MTELLHPHNTSVKVRNTIKSDIPKIIDLDKQSFPFLAQYGNIWKQEELNSHLEIFPEGQFVAVEPDGTIVGSASTLIVSLDPEYSLYGADISSHPKHRHEGIGSMLYAARKDLVMKLNLRRMISGGRLFNYCDYTNKMSALEYAEKVIRGELRDPVLSFELDNGFKFIKILPNYLDDVRSLNYASFIEWLNPKFHQ